MRFSGLMQPERQPASLSSVQNKRLRKQIVFEIGETIHSGPSIATPKAGKDEGIECSRNTVFPRDPQPSSNAALHPTLHLPSPTSAPQQPECARTATTTTPEPTLHAASVPQHLVPSIIVTEVSDPEYVVATQAGPSTVSKGTASTCKVEETSEPQSSVPEAVCPQAVFSPAASSSSVSLDSVLKTAHPQGNSANTSVPKPPEEIENQSTIAVLGQTAEDNNPKKQLDEALIIKKEQDTVVEDKNTSLEKVVKKEIVDPSEVREGHAETRDALVNESSLFEVAKTAATLLEIKQEPVTTEEVKAEAGESVDSAAYLPGSPSPRLSSSSSSSHPSLTLISNESKEMVRLIQDGDAKLDSFCHKRSSRASKRINSADFDHVLELKSEPVARPRRCTRTRKSSCRSDKSESEVSDSRSVADESSYFDMVDKTAKQGKPKNGEPLLDEATAHISAKYNGEVSSDLVNGAHKVKGRRVSRANSDESDCSSASRSNGNVEQNGDKVDFSVLLEISPADRKKFESKKAKIRRKTADWLLISETEQYYNEKEEIMRNKNKLDSDSDSDESDCTENQDSKSECSDESEDAGNSSRGRNKGKGKQSRTIDEDARCNVKRIRDDMCLTRKQVRPVGSRKRKTRYDLTMLNDDDDDDDENFFGFPISTTIPQGNPGGSTSSNVGPRGGRMKDSCKHSSETTSCPSSSGKGGRKRLSDAERFLRDNREYYHFQETPERLRRSSSTTSGEKERSKVDDEDTNEPEKKEEPRPKEGTTTRKRSTMIDLRRRVTRSTGAILEEPEDQEEGKSQHSKHSEKAEREKESSKKDDRKKASDNHKSIRKSEEEEKSEPDDESKDTKKLSDDEDRRKKSGEKTSSEVHNKHTDGSSKSQSSGNGECKSQSSGNGECKSQSSGNGECKSQSSGNGECIDDIEARLGSDSELHGLYFSFEGVPDQESWFQTYQRLIDGVSENVFFYEEDPLRFVLPYEMPKEYVRDFLCYKKGLLSKKKNDLADLVRKSPRCHPSTLALFSDIIPTKKTRNVKQSRSTPVKIDEASSDGTSTPGADSTRMQPPDSFESSEELAILAMHIDHVMKTEIGIENEKTASSPTEECKESEEHDLKKTPPKKRGKKKRLMSVTKPEKAGDASTKEVKLFESPFAHEVDPVFIAGLCDDMKDFLIPENILAREASEVIEDSFFCVCTDRASCDEFSSADDNTEASSECVSLCDSETIDGSIVSEPKRTRSAKKRRKNLTGWPKTQKKKKPVPSHTSDDNDSAIGWDDIEPKKPGCWKKHEFSLLEQTTSEKLAALAACDRRASPRKKASVLYMDTWPVRFRTHK